MGSLKAVFLLGHLSTLGRFHEAPSARGGNNRYDDYSNSQDGYGGRGEPYISNRSNIYSSDYERSGRQEVLPPPIDREDRKEGIHLRMGCIVHLVNHTVVIPRFGGSHGGRGESRYKVEAGTKVLSCVPNSISKKKNKMLFLCSPNVKRNMLI